MSDRPLRVAVVGAGPAGMFAAAALLAADRTVAVDVFDRLPTPFGLVRAGVAPDHANIKAVTRALERTAQMPAFRFVGHVAVGVDVSVAELLEAYDQVLLATGCEDAQRLGIPGEHLVGSVAATDVVGWYNGHPDHQHHAFDLSVRRVAVIGVGNVAMDVARILLSSPAALHATDIATPALEALRSSALREVVIVARRGPLALACTPAELQELAALPGVDLVVRRDDLEVGEAELAGADTSAKRNLEILRAHADRPARERRRVVLRMHRAPVAITGEARVTGITLAAMRVGPGGVVTDTGVRESIDVGGVIRAVGYRGRALAGVPFEPAGGTIPNRGGRVWDGDRPVPRLFVAGWAKRGPRGVIGTNRACAKETVAQMLADAAADAGVGSGQLPAACAAAVPWSGWEAIDAAERAEGEARGRPREKLLSIDELLDAARR